MNDYLVYPEHGKIVVPFRPDIAATIPSAQQATAGGEDILVLPHGRAEYRLLRNLGVEVPAPILHQYDWRDDTPFDSQRDTAALLSTASRAYVLNSMGTGKTRATLHAANFLMEQGDIRRVLIVAPLSTLTTVWEREIFTYFYNRSTSVLHGTKSKRLEALAEDADFYIINHDGVHTISEALLGKLDIDCVIVDELAAYRNATTRRWKALSKVIHNRKFVWGLTGAPTPNGPPDAWAQARLLTPENVPRYFKQWRDKTMIQVSQFRWVPRQGALNDVHQALQPSVRYRREDCLDLPETLVSDREVTLSGQAQRAYDRVVKDLRVSFQEGEVTVLNEGVRMNKLLQAACGFLYTTEHDVVKLDDTARLQTLKDTIEETDNKTIVFVPFVESLHGISQYVAKFTSVETVSGSVSKKERDRIFTEFQHSSYPRVIVAHPKCMAHGLTLTAADTIVWYCPYPDLEIYEQANARITRPGQQHKTLIVHLQGTPIEKRIYSRLKSKGTLQGTLLDMFRGVDDQYAA